MKTRHHMIQLLQVLTVASTIMASEASLFDTKFVELDASKMITTGDAHYAITGPSLPEPWLSISVNGNEVVGSTKDKTFLTKTLASLSPVERSAMNALRSTLTEVVQKGPFNVKSTTGLAKVTTFDRFGSTSSYGTGGGSSSSSSSASSSSDSSMSVSHTGPDSYIVSKSQFPFGWQRIFTNGDIDTVVYSDGRVVMLPEPLFKPEEREQLIALRQEVTKSAEAGKKMANSMLETISNSSPMEFVSKALKGFPFFG